MHSLIPTTPQGELSPSGTNCASSSSATGDSGSLFQGRPQSYMTDSEREAAIVRAGRQIEHWMALRNEAMCRNDFIAAATARANASRARRLMEALIAGRSPEAVDRMERERGLSVRAVDVQERV